MPEGPEIDTDKLHETIHEQLEREGGALLRKIALTTALLAALAAIAALGAGATVNEALVLKTEAARLQSEASNQWAYYQAKGIKAAVQEASRAIWLASGKTPPQRDRGIHEAVRRATGGDPERGPDERAGARREVSGSGQSDAPAPWVRRERRVLPGRDRAWRRGGADPEPAGLAWVAPAGRSWGRVSGRDALQMTAARWANTLAFRPL